MFTPAPALVLSDEQKAEAEALVRNGHTPQRVVMRCRLLLLACQGVANHSIAEQVDLSVLPSWRCVPPLLPQCPANRWR